MRNRSSLACQDANSSVNHTVNCIFSTYPQGEGLSTELFEQILNQHWGRQEADGKFGWLHPGS